jgi:hypothetical protein
VGTEAEGYISASILSGTTLAEGNITLLNNVRYKTNVRKIAVPTSGNVMIDAGCDFSTATDMSYTEAVLEPKLLAVNLELCKKDFIPTWEGLNMTAGLDGRLPISFTDYLIGVTAEQVAGEIETNIWNGGIGAGSFAGMKVNLLADATVVDVTGTTVNAGNVVAEMQKVLDDLPNTVYGKEDLRLYVPTSIWKFYIQAQATLGFAQTYNMGSEFALSFNGVTLAHAPGMADDTMICARISNLFFGTSGSTSEVRVLDMTDQDMSDNVRIGMRFSAGVQHGFGSDIVLYS